MAYRVGIDVGGTFTDLVALDEESGQTYARKVSSTPLAPEDGMLEALRAFLAQRPGCEIRFLAHSTTIATNALLGQTNLELPRVAFLTTKGFRDVLEIGRQNRSEVYNLFVTRPKPLAAREDRLAITERLDYHGNVVEALDLRSVDAAIAHLKAHDIRAVAVGFLHSYKNDAHEAAVVQRVREALPGSYVVSSAQIDPEYREYERFSTAVVSAALGPIVAGYIERCMQRLQALTIEAPLFVMQSHGGMKRADLIVSAPASIIESGPASGVIAAADLAQRRNAKYVLSFDMGGTTAKAGTVIDGRPQVIGEFEAAGKTHSGRASKGSGYPVRFPFIDLAEVSAGGGTVAWIDDGGSLRVGPISAGADPGPACYGKSDRATITDANVVLGRLNNTALLGGSFPIDAERSNAAVDRLAEQLHLSREATAGGILALVNHEMAKVLRIVTIERGLDPRDFTLVVYGGNGPLHACALAQELGVNHIVVPRNPGVFSAHGLLVAPLQSAFSMPILEETRAMSDERWEAAFAQLKTRAAQDLAAQGVASAQSMFTREAELRYAGQSFELLIDADGTPGDAAQTFHAKHEAIYGYRVPSEPVEIVSVRVTARSVTAPAVAAAPVTSAGVVWGQRALWDGAWKSVRIVQREGLPANFSLEGPAIIEQYDTYTYLADRWGASINDGDLILERA